MPSFKFISHIDKGGFGNVDIVQDGNGELFARKTFSKNQPLSAELEANVLKRFAKEVRIQKSISHQNIVPVTYYDLDSDPPFYLMPLAETTLAKELALDKRLGGHFIRAISDVVAALAEMHSMQIYHRDLKPKNVLRFSINGSDFHAVSDFGLISMKESQLSVLTSTGMSRQSDYYTAPEITKDLRFASVQSDVYSLGCILHDMVGTEDRVPCGEIREGGEFGPILLGCTKKDPKDRFKSVKSVLDAVASVDTGSYPAPSQKTTNFLAMLEGVNAPAPSAWKDLADFLDYDANGDEKRAVCLKLGDPQLLSLCTTAPEHANRIALVFANWVRTSSFPFDYCDALANRLETLFNFTDFEAKVECLIALLEMGTSHNRWYVERKFVSFCGPSMDPNLAKRLAVQFRIDDDNVCKSIAHLEGSIGFERQSLHPVLVKVLSEICS